MCPPLVPRPVWVTVPSYTEPRGRYPSKWLAKVRVPWRPPVRPDFLVEPLPLNQVVPKLLKGDKGTVRHNCRSGDCFVAGQTPTLHIGHLCVARRRRIGGGRW